MPRGGRCRWLDLRVSAGGNGVDEDVEVVRQVIAVGAEGASPTVTNTSATTASVQAAGSEHITLFSS